MWISSEGYGIIFRRSYSNNQRKDMVWSGMQQENLSIKLRLYRKLCTWGMKKIPDKLYLTMLYQVRTGKKIDWNNPKSFNEKLNWLKLYDRRPEYVKMVDKYEVRGLPTLVLIDDNDEVITKFAGVTKPEVIREVIKTIS